MECDVPLTCVFLLKSIISINALAWSALIEIPRLQHGNSISINALVWSATENARSAVLFLTISINALTWSATSLDE